MWKDPIVEEVRSIRERQAKVHDFEIRRIIAGAKTRQGTSGHPLVSFCKDRKTKHSERNPEQS